MYTLPHNRFIESERDCGGGRSLKNSEIIVSVSGRPHLLFRQNRFDSNWFDLLICLPFLLHFHFSTFSHFLLLLYKYCRLQHTYLQPHRWLRQIIIRLCLMPRVRAALMHIYAHTYSTYIYSNISICIHILYTKFMPPTFFVNLLKGKQHFVFLANLCVHFWQLSNVQGWCEKESKRNAFMWKFLL